MDFFSKLTQKASETYKGASEKAGKFAGETKLKFKINDNKSKINDIYSEIGKKVYEAYASNNEVNRTLVEDPCTRIDVLNAEIDTANKEILSLRDKKLCIKCNAELEKGARFCGSCGAEQPEEVKQPEVVENPPADATVTEPVAEETPSTEQQTNTSSETTNE